MKRLKYLMLALLMLCNTSTTVFAEERTISTTVPEYHSITIHADGAEVFYESNSGDQFSVPRLSEPTLLIRAKSGKEITQVLLGDEDILNQIKDGYYTLPPIYENKTLTVVTKDAPLQQGNTNESNENTHAANVSKVNTLQKTDSDDPEIPNNSGILQTGDSNNPIVWILIALIAFVGIVIALVYRRKSKKVK